MGQRQLNIVLDRANTPAEELYYQEEGDPILEDMPRDGRCVRDMWF